jgi:methylglutamate dehydrogenase subunit D
MSSRASALGETHKQGTFGNIENGAGVTLGENFFDFTAEIAAFPSSIQAVEKVVGVANAKVKTSLTFKIATNRWLAAGTSDFRTALEPRISEQDGTLTDLTHGRSAFVVSGPKVEWVLSKLYAVDFSLKAFPTHSGLATMHHDTFAHIYRSQAEAFDIFVFRSFARSFWQTLCHAAAETGYEVV